MTRDDGGNSAATMATFLGGGSAFAIAAALAAIEARWPWLAVGLAAGAAAQCWAIVWSMWIVREDGDAH